MVTSSAQHSDDANTRPFDRSKYYISEFKYTSTDTIQHRYEIRFGKKDATSSTSLLSELTFPRSVSLFGRQTRVFQKGKQPISKVYLLFEYPYRLPLSAMLWLFCGRIFRHKFPIIIVVLTQRLYTKSRANSSDCCLNPQVINSNVEYHRLCFARSVSTSGIIYSL